MYRRLTRGSILFQYSFNIYVIKNLKKNYENTNSNDSELQNLDFDARYADDKVHFSNSTKELEQLILSVKRLSDGNNFLSELKTKINKEK